ncbi:MAG: MFS transporter [Candidatus Woesearchaeota archaeon]
MTPGTDKRQIFGWSMYDFADTIFSALFVTVYFPIFVVLKGGNAFHVGLITSISMLMAGLLVPFLGAVADITKRKKLLLFIFTTACCTATFLSGFFGLTVVLVLALLAMFFYHASLDVYDSLLVDITHKKNMGWISGLGTAVGYMGAILSVVLAFIIGKFYGYETIKGISIVFMLTGALYFGFSMFTFFLVRKDPETKIKKQHLKQAALQVISTIKGIKQYKQVWLFLLASFLYVDGANTAIIFLFLYAKDQLGMALAQFLPLYIAMAFTAGIGSLLFGKITDKIGHKKTLTIVLALWGIAILTMFIHTNYATFLAVGLLGGALLGAIWTISRPLLISLAPPHKTAELLGYQGLTEKFSGVIGPFLYGLVAVAFGFRQALLIVIVLFFSGAAVLYFVKEKKPQTQ